MSTIDENLEKAKFFFELALKSNEYVQQMNERLGEKVRWFTSSASTLVPIIVGVGYYVLKQTTCNWIIALFSLSLASLVSAIIIGMVIQRPSGFLVLDPQTFMNKFSGKSRTFITNKSAATWSDIFVQNKKVVNSKENWMYAMLGLICFSLILLVAIFIGLGMAGYG